VQTMEDTRFRKKVLKGKFGGLESSWKAQEKMERCSATGCCQTFALSQLEADG
jgi:hypothetical protein